MGHSTSLEATIDPSPSVAIDNALHAGLEQGVFTGAVVHIARGGIVLKHASYGHSLFYRDRSTRVSAPIATTTATIFDLASLTKVVTTTTAVMQLVEAGYVALGAPICRYLPGFERAGKGGVTVAHVLTHTSGLPAGRLFYKRLEGHDTIVEAIKRVRLVSAPGAQVIYSDLGFITLGALVAQVAGAPLNVYAATHIFQPLGMGDTGYQPAEALRRRIAATEYQPGRGMVWGTVHDENAAAMGGVSGHAGLFASAADLAAFTAMLLGESNSSSTLVLKPETVRHMFALQTGGLVARRGYGWEGGQLSYMGRLAAGNAVGHTGFTGTSIVLDPERRLSVILLTNRVHPMRTGPDLSPIRAAVSDAAAL